MPESASLSEDLDVLDVASYANAGFVVVDDNGTPTTGKNTPSGIPLTHFLNDVNDKSLSILHAYIFEYLSLKVVNKSWNSN